ncbi:MAG: FtsX-like permease family protein, partial [Demequinaceae bacterium]|nr:FtsX-like permease family protein [Demequinaceae bacterium]
MILTLVREQLRSQARYAAAAFALVALAASLAAFVLISLATSLRETERVYTLNLGDTEHHASLLVWTNGVATNTIRDGNITTYTVEEIDSLVAELSANGSNPQVRLDSFVWMQGESFAHQMVAMDSVPPQALSAGTGPQSGQVALAQRLADALDVTVGDSVGFSPGSGLAPNLRLEVSGILMEATPLAGLSPPLLIVSSEDGLSLIEAAGFDKGDNALGEPTAFLGATLSWNGAVPADLTSAAGAMEWRPRAFTGQNEYYALTAMWLVLVTALVAAAAAGRSQGATRSQWVGTVRALGATRRDVVTAALLETVSVGVAGGLVGIAAGAAANVAVIRRHGGTFAGNWPSLTGTAIALSMALALAVSLVLGATPAYWAARTTPAAALSPVGPTDAVLSRPRVTTKALAALNVGAAALLLGWARANGNGEYWPRPVYFAATAIFALSLYVLMSRALVRVVIALGNALIRRGHRVLVAAGSGLVQHPRNAASIATAIAVGGIGAGAILWWWFVRPQGTGTELAPRPWSEIIESAGLTTLLTATVLGTASAVLSLAIWIGR